MGRVSQLNWAIKECTDFNFVCQSVFFHSLYILSSLICSSGVFPWLIKWTTNWGWIDSMSLAILSVCLHSRLQSSVLTNGGQQQSYEYFSHSSDSFSQFLWRQLKTAATTDFKVIPLPDCSAGCLLDSGFVCKCPLQIDSQSVNSLCWIMWSPLIIEMY